MNGTCLYNVYKGTCIYLHFHIQYVIIKSWFWTIFLSYCLHFVQTFDVSVYRSSGFVIKIRYVKERFAFGELYINFCNGLSKLYSATVQNDLKIDLDSNGKNLLDCTPLIFTNGKNFKIYLAIIIQLSRVIFTGMFFMLKFHGSASFTLLRFYAVLLIHTMTKFLMSYVTANQENEKSNTGFKSLNLMRL